MAYIDHLTIKQEIIGLDRQMYGLLMNRWLMRQSLTPYIQMKGTAVIPMRCEVLA